MKEAIPRSLAGVRDPIGVTSINLCFLQSLDCIGCMFSNFQHACVFYARLAETDDKHLGAIKKIIRPFFVIYSILGSMQALTCGLGAEIYPMSFVL